MSWLVDLATFTAGHDSGLTVKFEYNAATRSWDGKPTAAIPKSIDPDDLPRLMRESGEAFTEALRLSLQPICKRCQWTWTPRLKGRPIICPKCKSPYWDKPRKT